jgi:hypothetical protein
MTDYCSPSKNKGNICFSKESLLKLIESWNSTNKNNKIIVKKNSSIKTLWNLLDNKLKGVCDKGADWCWVGAIENMTSNQDIKRSVREIANKELKPEKPTEWLKNPHAWLSNYDIENVMVQYSKNKDFKYEFLGVFPIDFSVKNKFGKCLFSEICSINIAKYIRKGIKYIGLITNLDKHDQPGSHWTSTFIVIDPNISSYGAYYYDSTARPIPVYILNFLKEIKAQCDSIYPSHTFYYKFNKKQHQYKNTECGIFSIVFQIRWLISLKINKNTTFNDIIDNPNITDETMYSVRDVLFRPNSKTIQNKRL